MTFIIAEVGSNWKSLEDCLDSIASAKECGADAVKFQMYSAEELYGKTTEEVGCAGQPGIMDIPIEMKGILNPAWLPKLKEKADSCGIELMVTAFSVSGLNYVDHFVSRHKIASSDLCYVELLSRAATTGRPIYLSMGASSLSDIDKALHYTGPLTTLLYCVSSYPSTNINLAHITVLRRRFDIPIGYSCHTSDWRTAVGAFYHGASVIEKHFKLRDMDTPDSPHSILPEDFKKMVDAIREGKDSITFPHPSEIDMLKRHNRRLIAVKPIGKGEALVYNQNYGCYRSLVDDLEGLSGFKYHEVNGKLSAKVLNPGDAITPTSIER